mgnify:CR=1 FL=1
MGKGVVDESSDLFLGTAALSDKDYLHDYIKSADLIINIGHDVVEKPPFFMESGGTEVIHINYQSAKVDQIYFPQIEVIGNIMLSLDRLCEIIEQPNQYDLSDFEKVKANITEKIYEGYDSEDFPMKPQRIVSDIRKIMGYHDIIALDNGVYKIWFARNYPAFQPNTILLDNALATMGAGLPSAMMAAMLFDKRKVMAICGDGGFMMNSQELETAVRLKLNLVILILNDGAYGMVKWKQENMRFEDYGLSFNNPDFVEYAKAYGANGYKINSASSLSSILENCLNTPGIHVVDCPVDYSENDHILNIELKELSSSL